jgi:hypothetical protein
MKGQQVLSVLITKESLLDWIAILSMIRDNLGIALIVGLSGFQFLVQAQCEETKADTRAKPIKFSLSRNDLAALMAFLLKYYRDSIAEVDHMDFETTFDSGFGYLTFRVEEFAPSLSNDEALKRLGV